MWGGRRTQWFSYRIYCSTFTLPTYARLPHYIIFPNQSPLTTHCTKWQHNSFVRSTNPADPAARCMASLSPWKFTPGRRPSRKHSKVWSNWKVQTGLDFGVGLQYPVPVSWIEFLFYHLTLFIRTRSILQNFWILGSLEVRLRFYYPKPLINSVRNAEAPQALVTTFKLQFHPDDKKHYDGRANV